MSPQHPPPPPFQILSPWSATSKLARAQKLTTNVGIADHVYLWGRLDFRTLIAGRVEDKNIRVALLLELDLRGPSLSPGHHH